MNILSSARLLSSLLVFTFIIQSCQKTQSSNGSNAGNGTGTSPTGTSMYVKRIIETGYNTSGVAGTPITFSFSYNSDSNVTSIVGSNGFEYDFTYNSIKQLSSTFYKNPDNSIYGPNAYENFRYNGMGVSSTSYSLTNVAYADSFNFAYYTYANSGSLTAIIFPDLDNGNILTSIDNIQYGTSGNIDSYFDNHDSTNPSNKPNSNIYKYSTKDANVCPTNNKIAFTVLGMFKLWGPLFYSYFTKEITSVTTNSILYTYTYEYNNQSWVTKVTETTLETPQGNPGGNIPVNLEYKFEY